MPVVGGDWVGKSQQMCPSLGNHWPCLHTDLVAFRDCEQKYNITVNCLNALFLLLAISCGPRVPLDLFKRKKNKNFFSWTTGSQIVLKFAKNAPFLF